MYDPSILTLQLSSKNMPSTSDDYEREIWLQLIHAHQLIRWNPISGITLKRKSTNSLYKTNVEKNMDKLWCCKNLLTFDTKFGCENMPCRPFC